MKKTPALILLALLLPTSAFAVSVGWDRYSTGKLRTLYNGDHVQIGTSTAVSNDPLFVVGTSTSFFDIASSTGMSTFSKSARFLSSLLDSSSSAGTSGYILQTTGSSVNWVSTSTLGINSSNWSTSVANTLYPVVPTNRVMIGTSTQNLKNTVFAVSATSTNSQTLLKLLYSDGASAFQVDTSGNVTCDTGCYYNGVSWLKFADDDPVFYNSNNDVIFEINSTANDDSYIRFGTSATPTIPTIQSAGNTNTSLDIEALGAGNLYLQAVSTGNVAIGNTTPTQKLTVLGNAQASILRSSSVGTASAPTFSFSADTNTGIYKDGSGDANRIGFTTNGTQAGVIDSNQHWGIGTTTPWGTLSISNSAITDYTVPLFTVSTSSNTHGELFNIFATTTPNGSSGGIDTSLRSGVRVVVGKVIKTFQNFFVNGSFASSWQNLSCDGSSMLNSISADTGSICGWAIFDEATAGTLGSTQTGGPPPTGTDNLQFLLTVTSGTTNDGVQLGGPFFYDTGIGTSTPSMEVLSTSYTPSSTTTAIYIGFVNAASASSGAPGAGCFLAATSTSANWMAVSDDSSVTYTSTGVATTTSPVLWRIEMNPTECNFYAKTTISGTMDKKVTHTSNIPTTGGVVFQPVVRVARAANGNAVAPTFGFTFFRFWRALPWYKSY